jgi:predicted component of type VI protein secretion system
MPRPLSATAVGAAAILTLLAGCGRVQAVGPNRTLTVAVTEYRINPQSVTARPGQLTIVVHNYGRLSHNLAVLSGSVEMAATPPLSPGQSAAVTVDLTRGTYALASTVMSDQALGAYGTLTVR